MAVDDPWAIDGVPLSALEWRRATSGLLLHDTDPVAARPGVLSGCGITVAGLTATVGAGQLVVTPQVGSNGSYLVGMTATALPIAARNATYARIDRVIARVYDNSVDGSGQDKAAVEIVTGAASASPVAPALPAGALELAQLQVPNAAGGAIVVVDRRVPTVAAGGAPRYPSTEVRDLAPLPRVGDVCMVGASEYRCITAGTWTPWSMPWQAYTPTWNGITALGNGATAGKCCYRDGDVQFRAQLTVGTTTTFAPQAGVMIYPSLPVPALTPSAEVIPAWVWDQTAPESSRWMPGVLVPGSYLLAGGTRLQTPNLPFALAGGDLIRVAGPYQPA